MLNRDSFISPLSYCYRGRSPLLNIVCFALPLFTASCTITKPANPLDDYKELSPVTVMDAPAPDRSRTGNYTAEQVKRGQYMVALLGCTSCHTDGALVGAPDSRRFLAGSDTGIAYSNPLKQKYPGVVYPANLTPDMETGLGAWTDEDILQMLRNGVTPDGRHTLSVMPWTAYSRLSDEDARAIVAYLRGLPPVHHKVPENVAPGQKATEPYVHFGVYQSR